MAIAIAIVLAFMVWAFTVVIQLAALWDQRSTRQRLIVSTGRSREDREKSRLLQFTILLLSGWTLVASGFMGFAASWAFNEVSQGKNLWSGENGVRGSIWLAMGTVFVYMVGVIVIILRLQRKPILDPSDVKNDANAINALTKATSRSAELEQLEISWKASRARFRKQWKRWGLDYQFIRFFGKQDRWGQAPRRERLRFLIRWSHRTVRGCVLFYFCILLTLVMLASLVLVVFNTWNGPANFWVKVIFVIVFIITTITPVILQILVVRGRLKYLAAYTALLQADFLTAKKMINKVRIELAQPREGILEYQHVMTLFGRDVLKLSFKAVSTPNKN